MQPPDPTRLDAFLGRMIGDLGSIATGALVVLGDRLGFYKAMQDAGPMTSRQLAERTGTYERNVREWLAAQAAAGYVDYDRDADTFALNPEQATVFADDDSPAFMAGAFEVLASLWLDESKVAEAFRSGRGLPWHDHSACLFRGTERFFRPGYNANLVSSWLPALDGVVDRLQRGAEVADVGCGHGASTIVMARAFPKSRFTGFDYHPPSVERARQSAAEAGVAGNTRFDIATAKTFPGHYDLVAFFDCLHDMGDPIGAARHVHEALTPGGRWMIVEPFAHDHLASNLNPVGRVYYAASTMICTPASLAQEIGMGLGAQAGEVRLRQVVTAGGFTHFRRAAETPFNMVFEARA
ncbi:class I SAM-dependent methyltransferase [Bradyrhizobium sp. U87765 SZCCT0131]|uniref:class I SAM-dependent methyltransferase n=1 Tax=unclassified Bradyrhizobium TaxID=2631580 RepID=UPI001BACEA77|nr:MULTISPECIES: class I SAM-dependent methyltransferase [unclassified Bradyrhizobium]MBR1217209.1 class I SAM-dependent methyltransferase [Bradyrhizobium sp. U87765 SZCCT0131]MBR1259035.1 class I SAM-dependent methyltransferase [Bradyrhizobium sp. U87765 SZCCT0134]MBR1305176.1 class I SAM-dependent methyltransferase [Bradyrhizobium sp. U87765 SZCCT0110]MBR1320962.1 class I SAM-dependent methyltransferase [Bradyrhizobium sp. U87765 SZCCT0109]MBR1350384.1 class I SAM-dependent methyltransferase